MDCLTKEGWSVCVFVYCRTSKTSQNTEQVSSCYFNLSILTASKVRHIVDDLACYITSFHQVKYMYSAIYFKL